MAAKRRSQRPREASSGAAAAPDTSPRSPSSQVAWLALALTALTLLVYAGVWSFEFVQFDDPEYVVRNPHIANGLTWPGIQWAFTAVYALNWHPLTWLSHMLDIQMFGLQPGPPHVVNLLLHIASTLLLFWFFATATGSAGRSAVVACLFAIHPLHVESVAWVSERKDVLSTFFFMLTLCAYLRYVRQPGLTRYLAVFACVALGLLAKPMLVTLPFVLLLLDWWPLGRFGGGFNGFNRFIRFNGFAGAWPLVREKLPLIALAAASSIATIVAQRAGGAVVRLEVIPFGLRVETALVSYVTYLIKMVWPANLYMYYPHAVAVPFWLTLASLACLAIVSGFVFAAKDRLPHAAVGWFWYLGTLVPVIGLVQVGRQALADRYTYIPLVGVFVLLVWTVADLVARWPARRWLAPLTAAFVIVPAALVARTQVQHWRNDASLWTHAIQTATGMDARRASLAVRYLLEEDKTGPMQALLFSQAGGDVVFPPLARQFLGRLFARHEQWDDAVVSFQEAIQLGPNVAEFHADLAGVYVRQGKPDAAVGEYQEALRLDPDSAQAHHELGLFLAGLGKTEEAVRHLAETARLRPDLPDAHRNLAVALAKLGRMDEAIKELTEALRLRPDDAEVRRALEEYAKQRGRSGK